mmetsp:Transcript_8692/g.19779  ORF Transcript_8692/g.19779 Transcript_8692/m.19779 type:complete len:233 (-) Transcript_8692:12-710(-)
MPATPTIHLYCTRRVCCSQILFHSFAICTRRRNQRLLPLAKRSRDHNLLDLQVVAHPEPRLSLHGKRAAVRLEALALPGPRPLLVPVRVDPVVTFATSTCWAVVELHVAFRMRRQELLTPIRQKRRRDGVRRILSRTVRPVPDVRDRGPLGVEAFLDLGYVPSVDAVEVLVHDPLAQTLAVPEPKPEPLEGARPGQRVDRRERFREGVRSAFAPAAAEGLGGGAVPAPGRLC